jgi:hypothetical protein
MFVFVELTKWLKYFEAPDVKSQEVQLYRYLAFQAGVHLNMGQVSQIFPLKVFLATADVESQLSLSPVPGCFRFVYAAGNTEAVALAIARIREALSKLEARHSILGLGRSSVSIMSEMESVSDQKRKEPAAEPKSGLRSSIVRLLSCTPHSE